MKSRRNKYPQDNAEKDYRLLIKRARDHEGMARLCKALGREEESYIEFTQGAGLRIQAAIIAAKFDL